MYNTRSRGFTLIELLVVIAIIGILSAVVLASLNTARSKGSDAAIQSDLNTIQTQAEMFYGISNTYGPTQAWVSGAATSCTIGMFGNSTIIDALKAADSVNGSGNVICWTDGTNYVVGAALVATANTYWCADSRGVARSVNAALPTVAITQCP